jgi:hemolysin activation/secretion protein
MSKRLHGLGVSLIVGHALCLAAQAAQPPTGGELLQQVPAPPQPAAPAAPVITIVRPDASIAAPGESFPVRQIEVSGNSAIASDKIRDIVAPSEGKILTLADLQKLAARISALYLENGYPFSQAYIPTQTLQDGHVRIVILEAHYDSIVLRNRSRADDSVAQWALSGLKVGMPVDQASLDRALLLTSDIPATEVKGTLRPGKSAGASELLVDVDAGPATRTFVSADDYGNAATGRARLNANFSWFNPLHLGDVLSLGALTSGNGMTYGRVGYAIPVDGPATQIEGHVSSLGYRIVNGGESALEAHGIARVFGVGVQHALLRSTNADVTLQASYDDTLLRDDVDVSALRADRHTQDWRVALNGTREDRMGSSAASAGFTRGWVLFDDPTTALIDGSGARTGGQFVKYLLSASRLQRLDAATALSLVVTYQGAGKNLDSSEQLFIGGPNSVRAYDNGVASGSQGDAVSLDLLRDLGSAFGGKWQGSVFADTAHVQIEKNAYTPGLNGATLSGAGLGLNWGGAGGLSLASALAFPIGATPAVLGDRESVKVWVRVQKEF